MSNHTHRLHNISVFNPSSPGSTPSASSSSAQFLSSCRMQLPGTSPCAPVASFVVAGACLAGMVPWRCCFPFSESPASSLESFLAFLLDFYFFKTRERMHPPQDRPNSCLLTQHLPNAGSLESLHPSAHCSNVSLGVGKGCWWWERRVSTAQWAAFPSLVEGEIWDYFRCLPGFCEEKAVWSGSLQPASPWVLLVSALWPFAGSSGCHMLVHGQVWGGSVPRHCPFPAPPLLPEPLGAHLVSSKAVLGKVLA